MTRIGLGAGALLLLSACAAVQPGPAADVVARAALVSPDGTSRGSAAVRRTGGSLTLRVEARGISAGSRGAHLHAVGRCDPPDFTSAGPHLNPAGRQHGTLNAAGRHLGDLPNIVIGADGAGTLDTGIAGAWAADEVLDHIFDSDGTALVIHAGPDDQRTDPSGNSGARIVCGVLTRP